MLSQLKAISHGMEIGLYKDDGLAVIDQTPQKIEKIKKRNVQSVRQKQPTHYC